MRRFVVRVTAGAVAVVGLAVLLIGLPWALIAGIGWPLPTGLPTSAEFPDVLRMAMTPALLLDLLACLCWVGWAFFVTYLGRGALDALRYRRLHHNPGSPVQATATVLIGLLTLALSGERLDSTSPTTLAATVTVPTTSTGNPADHQPDLPPSGAGRSQEATNASHVPTTVVVEAPRDGVHDSLWRIARRTLGDGARWPDIYHLNHGRPQPNGGTFTDPGLIHPGQELLLPTTQPAPAEQAPAADERTSAPPSTPTPTASQRPTSPTNPAVPEIGHTDSPAQRPSSGSGPSMFVGAALAAAVSAALLLARRHRQSYRPGSGRRDQSLPAAPVVYDLHLAHLRESQPADDEPHPDLAGDLLGPSEVPPPIVGPGTGGNAAAPTGDPSALSLGAREGREIAVDLAVTHGLGLIGDGARAALRAVLVTLLAAAPSPGTRIVVPAEDLDELLGRTHSDLNRIPNLDVAADLDAALDLVEAELLRRLRTPTPPEGWPCQVIVARISETATRRLQSVLDNGTSLAVVGLLLGPWPAGATVYVRADGLVTATNRGPARRLLDAHMFHLPDTATVDLLNVLQHAAPATNTVPGSADAPSGHGDPAAGTEQERLGLDVEESESDQPGPSPSANASEAGLSEPEDHLEVTAALTEPDASVPSLGGANSMSPAVNAAEEPHSRGTSPGHIPPLALTILGKLSLWWHRHHNDSEEGIVDLSDVVRPRQWELLTFLALHPQGVSRSLLVRTLWADAPPQRPTNALNTALTRLRKTLREATGGRVVSPVVTNADRYHLDPTVISVDYHDLAEAVVARREAVSDRERLAADRHIMSRYPGPLAEDLNVAWLEPLRESCRRDALDAVSALARATVTQDPATTLELLETARAADPHNELLYRDIMRLQSRLSRPEAIPRTLALLTTSLAEIDDAPTSETRVLAEQLQHRKSE
ncbi:transcriptional regulator [Actinoalloteichus caeruleus]|uniref:transcriptional regulator n=1 Tax=Actinoalloteichus cyanogriseus TaxID=2893586 RepID=UPI003BB9A352